MADAAALTCEVHGEPLAVLPVRIVYNSVRGSPKLSRAYFDARRQDFPHCDDAVVGGCVVWRQQALPKGVCPACCEARDAWLRQHCAAWAETNDPSGW